MRLYQKSLIPISGVIFGQTIYWLTIFSSFLVILGTIISFVEKDSADTDWPTFPIDY